MQVANQDQLKIIHTSREQNPEPRRELDRAGVEAATSREKCLRDS